MYIKVFETTLMFFSLSAVTLCMFSGFRGEVVEICCPLGYLEE
jgi:hypothetical protein